MKNFPNKMIAMAYESAKGKVFRKYTANLTYIDQNNNKDYDHIALNWLEDKNILQKQLNRESWVYEYRIVK
jgi:hypothetical protein